MGQVGASMTLVPPAAWRALIASRNCAAKGRGVMYVAQVDSPAGVLSVFFSASAGRVTPSCVRIRQRRALAWASIAAMGDCSSTSPFQSGRPGNGNRSCSTCDAEAPWGRR